MIVRRSLQEHFTVEDDENENVVPFIVADFLAQAEKNLSFLMLQLAAEGGGTAGEGVKVGAGTLNRFPNRAQGRGRKALNGSPPTGLVQVGR